MVEFNEEREETSRSLMIPMTATMASLPVAMATESALCCLVCSESICKYHSEWFLPKAESSRQLPSFFFLPLIYITIWYNYFQPGTKGGRAWITQAAGAFSCAFVVHMMTRQNLHYPVNVLNLIGSTYCCPLMFNSSYYHRPIVFPFSCNQSV